MSETPTPRVWTAQAIARLALERNRRRQLEGHPPYQPPDPKRRPEPLCPGLAKLLRDRVGPAQVGRPGRARYVQRGYREIITVEPGEFLRVNCPVCGDTRQQLTVAHTWDGTDGANNDDLLGLPVRCWAEDCMSDGGNRLELAERLFAGLDAKQRRALFNHRPGREVRRKICELRRCRLGPGKLVPLHRLPVGHAAATYLRGLGHDPAALGAAWSLSLCVQSRDHPAAEGRLILPVIDRGEQVGWQALYPDERDWKGGRIPRYYTPPEFPSQLTLYNLGETYGRPVVVVCAQPADVWAVGPAAVAPLGPVTNPHQHTLLWDIARCHTMVVLRGAGNVAEVERIRAAVDSTREILFENQFILHRPRPPVVVDLPGGGSPADLPFAALWASIRDQAAEQGVEVPLPAAGLGD